MLTTILDQLHCAAMLYPPIPGQLGPSCIYDIFYGQEQSFMKCLNCQTKFDKTDPFNSIHLNLYPTLYDAFDHAFTEEEVIIYLFYFFYN